MRTSGIGGQAVMEGIMMKNKETYALAVRLPNGEIKVETDEYKGFLSGKKFLSLPFIRGVFNFVDSLVLGTGTLMRSSLLSEGEEEGELTEEEQVKKEKDDSLYVTITVAVSIVIAVGLFMLLPLWISGFFRRIVVSSAWMAVIEGAVRLLIFVAYLFLISRMKEIQRVFMYHGAEHKCINCIEHGMELNVENVRKSSKQHKRCGTSFLFIVIVVSIGVGFFIQTGNVWFRLGIRLLLLPVIAGISYEFIRLAGRSESGFVNLLSRPGLAMQNLTTREPDDGMIEVAIAAVEAVFDWKAFLAEETAS
ncbi:MAG: DUF1385 domain-containing protein [Lachnospiraceae bacterium]|nr:DUF1385 domain-containing protein [Lachnospiraceae bacterium]